MILDRKISFLRDKALHFGIISGPRISTSTKVSLTVWKSRNICVRGVFAKQRDVCRRLTHVNVAVNFMEISRGEILRLKLWRDKLLSRYYNACLSLVIIRDSARFGRRFRRSANGLIIMKMLRFGNEEGIVGNNRDREITIFLFTRRSFLFSR